LKKLTGNTDIEDSLERLDKLTQEEARMASAELLKMTHIVDDGVKDVKGKVLDVRDGVQDVRGDVQVVGNKVQGVDGRVQDVHDDVQDVGIRVQDVDDKLDQANRSLFL
jgi:methyl-accepting chemotaxis protein